MSLVPRFSSIAITAGRRCRLHPSKVAQPAIALSLVRMDSTLQYSTLSRPAISGHVMASTRTRFAPSNISRFQEFSSDADFDTSDNGKANPTSGRSRFKEIPVHPSILEYIRRVGVGRQGKETRRKRHPHGKKKKKRNNNNSEQHYQQRQDNDTMSREEERLFLGNGRVARRSGVGTSATNNRQQRSISPIVPPAPPPPFGEGQSFRTESDNDSGEKERKIRVLPAKVLGRVTPSDENNDDENLFPRSSSGLPEVAIVGRSNVGKSTLLNALLYSGKAIEKEESEAFVRRRNRRLRSKVVTSQTAKLPKGIKAKTSSKPGETRSIDFYQLSAEIEASGNKKKSSLLLVDLPGYGFAFGPKKERKQMEDSEEAALPDYLFPWQSLIETYVTNRPRSSLKRVLLLIDARHGMKQADSQFLEGLQRALIQKQRNVAATKSSDPQQHPRVPTELPPLQIVLTKCDLVSQVDLARRVVQVREQLSDCLVRQPKMLPEMLVSAQIEGQGGVLELQKELASLCSADFQ